jgi:hypothetical protein
VSPQQSVLQVFSNFYSKVPLLLCFLIPQKEQGGFSYNKKASSDFLLAGFCFYWRYQTAVQNSDRVDSNKRSLTR